MTTLRDISKRLGVSVSTVSRALSGQAYVNEQVRARIQEVADELDYRPNALARGLRRNQTRTVGLVVPNILNVSYTSAASVLQGVLQKFGYGLALYVTNNDRETERLCFQRLREQQVDGLVHIPTRASSPASLLGESARPIPLVQMFRRSSRDVDAVVYDEETGAQQVVSYLIQLGHRRIGVIAGPAEYISVKARLRGAKRAVADAGLEPDDLSVIHREFASESGRQALHRLLDSVDLTAVFPASVHFVLGSLLACTERNLDIPGQLSLAGFGDPHWYQIMKPPITSYTAPLDEMGMTAAQLLISRMEDPPPSNRARPTQIVISGTLLKRESTAPPAG